jgi:undecaprenyl-diphosphatase
MSRTAPRSSLVAFLAAFVGPLLLFAALATEVTAGGGPSWDASLMRALNGLDDLPLPPGTQRLVDNSPVGGALLLMLLIVGLAVRKRIRDAVFLTVAVVGVALFEPLLKGTFGRQPPGEQAGFSFPSGSAMGSMTIVAVLAVLAWPTRARWLVVLGGAGFVIAFGAAIVDLRWHYPSDVIAGWCVAVVWVSALWMIGRRIDAWRVRRADFDGAGP